MSTLRFAYFDQATKLVSAFISLSAPAGAPDPQPGKLATITEYRGPLPAYWTGTEVLPLPHQPSPAHEWSGQALAWVLNPSLMPAALAEAQAKAQAQVDAAAGQARLRHITDVPGQQATYQRKEQQAREWVNSGYSGPAPSFIAAEAQALGETPQHIAQQVITLADYWAYVKGPEIEAARIKWKAAVRAADTLEAVQATLNGAINELEAL
jgi:hypothetical protein